MAKKGRKSGRQPGKQTEVSRKRAIEQAKTQDERVPPPEALMTPVWMELRGEVGNSRKENERVERVCAESP